MLAGEIRCLVYDLKSADDTTMWRCLDVMGMKRSFFEAVGAYAAMGDKEMCLMYRRVGALCRTDAEQGSRVRGIEFFFVIIFSFGPKMGSR